MKPGGRRWAVRLTAAAESDLRQILGWTAERFGEAQARIYAETLALAIEALATGSSALGAKQRPEIGRGVSTLHVAREGRRGRHFVIFRAGKNQDQGVDVLRILHDAMDLPRHLPADDQRG